MLRRPDHRLELDTDHSYLTTVNIVSIAYISTKHHRTYAGHN